MVKLQKPKPIKLGKGVTKMLKPAIKQKSNDNKTKKLCIENSNEVTLKLTSLKNEQNLKGLDMKNCKEGVQVLLEMYAKTSRSQNKKQLLDDVEEPIFLQVNGIKIPKCRNHTLRVDLPHSYHPKDLDICLISADLPNANLRDYDKVTEHYEDILKSQHITNIKTIIPFHQLRNEYQEFELKRKLVGAYDIFLADSKIHGKVVHFLGNTFDKARKVPRILSFEKPNVKAQIERILSQTNVKIHNKGNSTGIQVGLVNMKKDYIVDNVVAVAAKLPIIYPGGGENIRSMSIKTTKSMAIPLYLTLKMKSNVEIPNLKAKRPNKCIKYTDDLSTLLNTQVTVLPSGHVKTRLIKKHKKEVLTNEIGEKSEQTENVDQDHSDSTDLENEDVDENITNNEEIEYFKQFNETKLDSKSILLESKVESVSKFKKSRIPKLKNDALVSNPVEGEILHSKRGRRSDSKNLPETSQTEEVTNLTQPIVHKIPKRLSKAKIAQKSFTDVTSTDTSIVSTPKPPSKSKNTTKTPKSSQAIVTRHVVNETTITPSVKRKRSSATNTSIKKKQKLIKNPFYRGNTTK